MTSKLLSFLYNVATIFSILFRFLNRIFVPIFRKFIKFGSLLFNNCYFYFSQLYSNYTILFNWLLFILSAFCIYYFFVDITSIDIFQIAFIFSQSDVICLSNIILRGNIKSIKASSSKSNKQQNKSKSNFVKVTVPFNELTEIKFLQVLMLNLKLHSLNTILFQYNEYSSSIHIMLGPQVGIVVKDSHNISYYRKLFQYYKDKLEIQMSFYTVGLPYFRYIYFKEIQVEDHIRIGDL